ncbi:MAG: acetoacetate decarboxylase family protein [Halorientalis sp.]
MVLQGDAAGYSPPFDAPLYGGSIGRSTPAADEEFDFRNCQGAMVYFSIDNDDIADVLPEGVTPFGSPPHGVAWITRYPFSSVGEYDEFFSLIQVEDLGGEMAYYVPYIYVDNDAGMASGREVVGAPKKRAEIDLDPSGPLTSGTLERPDGRRLATLTVQPEQQVEGNALLDAAIPDPVPMLSLRHVPPIEGEDGLTQLVEWYARIHFHEDARGSRKVWMGPGELTYDSPSKHDPIHKLAVDGIDLALYFEYDMELGARAVQKEWRV